MSDATTTAAKRVLVYGANGYTGHLVARIARELPNAPDLILAGRSGPKVGAIAEALSYETRVFGLDVPSTIDACLEGVGVVLHCAGPFSRTARPMFEACLRNGVHYLDVAGELDVFEALAARDDEARAAGIMVMPGVGFDVVPSDCLAVHVARRIAHPTRLTIGLYGQGAGMSHGTATTAAENISKGTFARKDGVLQKIPTGRSRTIDFGRGPRPALAVPLADLATAFRSTGIGDIETYFGATRGMIMGVRAIGFVPWLISSRPIQKIIKRRIDKAPAGPSDAQRATGRSIVWAECENAAGERATSRLETPEGYTLTAYASLTIARRVLAGEHTPGYQTPAQFFGPDFVLGLPGNIIRTDA